MERHLPSIGKNQNFTSTIDPIKKTVFSKVVA
jgi:hypothetical protein